MSSLDQLKIRAVGLLRWSEKYTKTDMLYLTQSGFWSSLGQVVAVCSALALSVAFANLLPPEVFGQYRYILSAAGIIGAFALTGMNTAMVQAVARGYEGALRAGFSQSMRWSIGTVILALGGGAYYYLKGNSLLALAFLPIAIATPIILSSSLYQGFLNGKKDFRRLTLSLVIYKIVQLSAIIFTIVITHNPILLVAVYFALEAGVSYALYLFTIHVYTPGPRNDPDILSYSKHLSVMNGVKLIAAHIDKVLVFQGLGAVQLAIYSFALAPVTQLKGLNQTIAGIAFPKMSERSYAELQQTLPRKVFLLMLIMACLSVLYIVAAPYIFKFVFPQYVESIPYTQVLALTLIFAPQVLFSRALMAHKKNKRLYVVQVGVPSINILSLIILLPLYGIWGTIFSALLTSVVATVLSLYLFLKQTD